MKKLFPIILFGVLFCISVLCFLKYDNKRFDYGWECDFCNKSIPFGLKVKEYNTSYVLLDEDEYNIVGIGFRYQTTDFKIKDFIGYGYNDTSVVVKCTDSLNTIRYLTSYEMKYKSKKGNPEISFKDLGNSDLEQVKGKYNWVVFNHEEAQKATFKRFLSAIGALLSFILLLISLFKLRIRKALN